MFLTPALCCNLQLCSLLMESLKSLVPEELRQAIAGGTCESLPVTCGRLLQFFLRLPHFQQVISELTDLETALCRKDKLKALDFKLKGNECFSKGDFTRAISFYCEGLRYAPVSRYVKELNLVATLYVNRASSFHKLGLLEESLRDCNRAIALKPNYAKAWYRRGKVNESLRNYKVSISDLKVALTMEETATGQNNIKKELNVLNGKSDKTIEQKVDKSSHSEESSDVKLQTVTTFNKGRGIVSPNDISPASLIHSENPIAAIITKQFRQTHCHYCFQKVNKDGLYCTSCTIPIYCSDNCFIQATGKLSFSHQEDISRDVINHVENVICENSIKFEGKIAEHKHECGGAHWSVVLPCDVVLAGRVMTQKSENRILDFVHHYERLSTGDKFEMHIYAIVLYFCMQKYNKFDFSSTESFISELVLLICKIKFNSMAIVHVDSTDGDPNFQTTSINQVRVGQAIYSTGSLFNHSCKPNSNIYFISRTLFVRTTEFVLAGTPLEISYGPQVGEIDLIERQKTLEDQYKFKCDCSGCSNLNFSDLVINSFSCPKSDCFGAVLGNNISLKLSEDYSAQVLIGTSQVVKLSLPSDKNIDKVTSKIFQKSEIPSQIDPGNCLNCNSYQDLDSANKIANNAKICMDRLLDSINEDKMSQKMVLLDALDCLEKIRSVKHSYSKAVAQAEDSMGELFAKTGDMERALKYCKASIEILERLYHSKHVTIGHELIKLATIQTSLCHNSDASDTIKRVEEIFSLYYGPHAKKLFPYINTLSVS
ncbi:hypothetical protein LUZ60_014753 [Juncus effusus]|nr:hypothetical protein LUZ60_014753 [Juncus effusus]